MAEALVCVDRVRETTTTTGTGNITLAGAVSQYVSFNTAFGTNVSFYYEIADTAGTNWEIGIGYLTDAVTLVRETVLASTNSNALVNFTSGACDVFNTEPAFALTRVLSRGRVTASALRCNLL